MQDSEKRGRGDRHITAPAHTKFEIRFRSVAARPALEPQEYTPMIGVGDLLRYNAGQPRPMLLFGEPIATTHHGPHAWAGDLDGDGLPDLVTCAEWSVYPFYSHLYSHHSLEMSQRAAIRFEQ